MKIAYAILQDVLVSRCGVDAAALESSSSTLGELFAGWRTRPGADPFTTLQLALNQQTPEIDWGWLHGQLTLDDLTAYFELALDLAARAGEPTPAGVHARLFYRRSASAHRQTLMWSTAGCFVMLAGMGGQSTGLSAASLGLLAMVHAAPAPTLPLAERLTLRVQAIDAALKKHHTQTRHALSAALALLEVTPDQVGFAHVGCQAQLGQLHGQALRWRSADHSLLAAARAHGVDSPEAWMADLAVRGLGFPPPVGTAATADVHLEARRPGDRFWLLAGKGGGTMRSDELEAHLALSDDAERVFTQWCDDILRRAPNELWERALLEVAV